MDIISYIAISIPVVPAIMGVVFWKRLLKEERWFAIMLVAIALNGAAGFLAEKLYSNNMPFFHAYLLVEGMFLIRLFRFFLVPYLSGRVFDLGLIAYGLFWVLNVIFWDGFMGYPTYILPAEGVLLIALATLWFVRVMQEKVIQNPERQFAFWVSTGVLIFFSGNLLLFFFSNYVFNQDTHVFVAIWDIHALLVILLYIFYSIALLWARKNQTSY